MSERATELPPANYQQCGLAHTCKLDAFLDKEAEDDEKCTRTHTHTHTQHHVNIAQDVDVVDLGLETTGIALIAIGVGAFPGIVLSALWVGAFNVDNVCCSYPQVLH